MFHPEEAHYTPKPPKSPLSSSEVTPEALRVHQSRMGILRWKKSLSKKAKFLEPECFLEPGRFGALPAEGRQRFPWKPSCLSVPFPSLHLVGFQRPQIQLITWATLELDPSWPSAPRMFASGSTALRTAGSSSRGWELQKPGGGEEAGCPGKGESQNLSCQVH